MKFSTIAVSAVAIASVSALHLNLSPVKRGLAKIGHHDKYAVSAYNVKSNTRNLSAKAIFKAKSAEIDSKLHDAFEKFTSLLGDLLTLETEEDLKKLGKQLQDAAKAYDGLNGEEKEQLELALGILDEIVTDFLNNVSNPKEGTIMKDIKFEEALKNLKTQDDKNELIKKIEASAEKLINSNKNNADKIIEITVEAVILHDLVSYMKLNTKKGDNKPAVKPTGSGSLSEVVGLEALLNNIKNVSEIQGVLKKIDEAYNKLKAQKLNEDQKVELEVEYMLIKQVLEAIQNGGVFVAKPDSIAGYRKIEELICKAKTALDFDKALQEVDIGYVELLAKNPKREIELKAEHKILRQLILEIKVFTLNNQKSLVTRSKDAMISFAKRQIINYLN